MTVFNNTKPHIHVLNLVFDVKELKRTMKIMTFEIYGLLKQTRVDDIRTSVPTYPELSSKLRKDILK